MVSRLIWRHVSLLYVVQSNILRLNIQLSYHYRCKLYLQIIDFQFPSCCKMQPKKLNQINTVNSFTNTPITKKITLSRFACLCFYFADSSIQFVTSCMSVVVIQDISQTLPFHWYITCGLLIHCYHFRKVQFFSGA